jgi:hypothetical protein
MVPDLVGGVRRQAEAGNGKENFKKIEENRRMALGRISHSAFPNCRGWKTSRASR